MSRQTSKQMAKEICHDNISFVAKGLNIEDELCRDKRQRVTIEHKKNVRSQLRQRKLMLQQGLSAGCQHQEEPVVT